MVYRYGFVPFIFLTTLVGLFPCSIFAAEQTHIVVWGDTIFSLSRTYQIGEEELMRYNGLADPSMLRVGMKLVIPVEPSKVAAVAGGIEYTVLPNDTLFSIARKYSVTLQALRDINKLPSNHVLKVGERIRIPQTASNTAPVPSPTVASPPDIRLTALPPGKPVKVDASIRWPIAAKQIVYMNNNNGVLVSGVESESIKSLTSGTVIYAGPWRGYGNVAVVESGKGYQYLYGACETLSVRKGDVVESGAELGKLGVYPASRKPELVLIVLRNGSPVDPVKAPRS